MPTPTNIILITSEDVGLHHGCYGNDYATTPNLDAFAAGGTRYVNAVSTAPVCSPSRCSIITGQYPWSIGTHHHRSKLITPPRCFTHELRDAGWHVRWSSKTDFNFTPPDDFTDGTDDWLDELRGGTLPDQPFFLYHNLGVTHESTMWRYDRGGAACTSRVTNQRLLGEGVRHDWRDAPLPAYLPDEPEVRADIARYFDALQMADAQFGDMLAALRQSPYAGNTIVMYASDHGRGLPREKRWCYEAGIHLPLIVAGPGVEAGQVDERVVNWVDIAPTILSLAGVDVPQRMQGVAFLGEQTGDERRYAFAGRGRMDETYDCVRACRDKDWLYLRNGSPQLPYMQHNIYEIRQATTQVLRELHARGLLTGPPAALMSETKPPEELYNVHADPDCVHNLADDPAHADDLDRLRAALDEHLETVGDLGAVPERELIDSGLLVDQFAEWEARREPLQAAYAIGEHRVCAMEMPEENRRRN